MFIMKKALSAGLALLMLLLCIVPTFALEQSMEISTKADVDYVLSFPADVEIPWMTDTMGIGEVKAVKMLIEPAKTVKVSVSSENDYKLVNTDDSQRTIAYGLTIENIPTGYENITFFPGDYGKAFPLAVSVTEAQWLQAASGRHSDILTFTIEYTDAV